MVYAYHCHPFPFKIQPILDVFEALFCVAEIKNGSGWALILSTKQLTPQFFVGRKTAHTIQGLVFIMKLRIPSLAFEVRLASESKSKSDSTSKPQVKTSVITDQSPIINLKPAQSTSLKLQNWFLHDSSSFSHIHL
jgi:hypothetical protein